MPLCACGFLNLWGPVACGADSNAVTDRPVVVAPWAPEAVSYTCDSNKTEPSFQGLSISQWLQTKTLLNTSGLTLSELLTLKQLSPADDWGIVRFELPISYDVMTNSGSLILGGLNSDGEFVVCRFAGYERATNGHCLLWWSINYDPPGKHNIRAQLVYGSPLTRVWPNTLSVVGPALPFYSSNVCMFFEGANLFDSSGAILQAKLREESATYRIELKTVKGKHIKTITGSTTNGMIDLDWNLADEHGKRFNGDSFEGIFQVVYPRDKARNPPARSRFSKIGGKASF